MLMEILMWVEPLHGNDSLTNRMTAGGKKVLFESYKHLTKHIRAFSFPSLSGTCVLGREFETMRSCGHDPRQGSSIGYHIPRQGQGDILMVPKRVMSQLGHVRDDFFV